jgi:type IV pilus assembly protein PilY1
MRHAHFRHGIYLAALIASFPALGGTLAEAPLFLQSAVPPNVLFALSVEFPTANTAAYQDSGSYSTGNTYLGIFHSEKCYTYDSTNNWFAPAAYASNHTCSNQWSGNFLNWATMTGLDEFRYAMTGGNRYQDTASLTVLERTYQSGQGGTSNFPNKTFTGSGTTPYPNTAALTIRNQGMGHRMQVSLGGSGTAMCSNPQKSGSTFSCDIALQTTNETGSCTTWTGTGTSNDPYTCQTFGAFSDGVGTPTSTSVGTKSSASSSAGTDIVTCASPTGNTNSNFSCTLTNASSTSGSCTTWIGNGTSTSPFSCSAFGSFGGTAFTATSQASSTSYTYSTQVNQAAETVSSCSISASSPNQITCSLPSGRTASCTPSGDGKSSGTPYNCSTSNSWTISGSPTASYVSNTNRSSTTSFVNSSGRTRYYYAPQTVTYSIPQTNTYYYIPSYTGTSGSSGTYYYYSTYSVTFGGSQIYFVRAKVCDTSVGIEDNCQLYGTSSYKPVGEVQRNGEKMRFGLFSYYNANDIDNAVMRSKMKYVAPLKWTSSGVSTANSNAEWSASTGVLTSNPDPTEATNSYGGAVSQSGVVNYINKFGIAAAGYKTYDNVGKLYYEGLRYLRGLTPTTAFYTRASTSNGDGFPVITSWDDPVLYSCQKNYIITMGDTHTHCDKRLPGGTSTAYGSSQCTGNSQTSDQGSLGGDTGVDVGTWTNAIGTLEGRTGLANSYFSGSSSYYMSGLAYWAAKDGFRTISGVNLKAKTYIIDVQEYADKGVNSQYWYATKYGGVDSYDNSGNPLNWSTTISGYSGNWPKTLLPAGNPAAMIAAVRGALSSISAQTGAGADVGLSTGDLRTGNGTNLYSATYNSAGWYGDIESYRMSSNLTIGSTPNWKTSTFLNPTTLNPGTGTAPWLTRRILTFHDGLHADGTADAELKRRQGVEFQSEDSTGTDVYSTYLSERQRALLDLDPGSTTSDGRGADRINYIRGDNSNEGSSGFNWRSRTGSIGDFINSSPVYVRYPSATNIPASDYDSFKVYATAIASRTPVLYVGSNDGMLHAINASDTSDDGTSAAGATTNSGKEMLAYVPAAVFPRLNQLSWPNYSHKYYVDGTPVVADAQLSSASCTPSSDAKECWRTVITGGLGGGGQGIYALNGTDPSTFSSGTAKSLVFWEFTDRDDADLGYTFAQPIVRKMNDGKWAVIFGNGYNNTTSDGSTSSTGRAFIYILYLDGPGYDTVGRGRAWTLNTDYRKIELIAPNEGSVTPLTPANGLSTTFALDKNSDGTVDYLYAGDRYGNMWKINVSSTNPADWGSAFGTTSSPLPLFTATTADTPAKIQQITTSPIVTRHPNGGYMVLFGTGSYVDQTDTVSPFSTNSFYGIWDKDDGTTRVTSRDQLQKQATLAISSGTTTYGLQSNCQPQYLSSATAPTSATVLCPASLAPTLTGGLVAQQLGWVLDLANDPSVSNSGERYISGVTPVLENGLLTFVTLTPSGDVCAGGGYDFVYNLDYLSGGPYSKPIYYDLTGTSASAISISFSYSSGGTTTTVTTYPSGKKLGTALGQNPKRIYYETDSGSATPTTGTGCSGYVAGRPCKKVKRACDIVTIAGGCTGVTPPATGRVSWRHIMQ